MTYDLTQLNRDVLTHLLLIQAPVDLFQVSMFIPVLRAIMQEDRFQALYRATWSPINPDRNNLFDLSALAVFREKASLGLLFRSTFLPSQLLIYHLDHQDSPTIIWLLRTFNFTPFSSENKEKILGHPCLTRCVLQGLFERNLMEISEWISHQENYRRYSRALFYLNKYPNRACYDLYQVLLDKGQYEAFKFYYQFDLGCWNVTRQIVQTDNLELVRWVHDYSVRHPSRSRAFCPSIEDARSPAMKQLLTELGFSGLFLDSRN